MPKGMVKHREEEESEARNGSLIGECVENGLMAGLKSIDPDLVKKIANWAKKTVSEVVGSALLVDMLDSDKTRIPCCAKCGHLRHEVIDEFPMPFCPFHGILGGDIEKMCCTEYQRKEGGSNE